MEIRVYIYLLLSLLCLSSYTSAINKIMVVHPEGSAFSDVIEGIKAELDEEEFVVESYLLKKLSSAKLKDEFNVLKPALIILMDNKSVTLYKKSGLNNKIPVLAMMGVNISSTIKDIPNSGAINYEIPIVTSLVNLRTTMNRSVTKVGVISRNNMKDFIKENKKYCKSEKIKLIHINIKSNDDKKIKKYISKGLDILIDKKAVDAIWIPNDIKLLSAELIKKTWSPKLKSSKIPAVVGIEKLLTTSLNFGTFAVLPDHYSLGSQAGQAIIDVIDNDGEFEEDFNEPPIGVYTIVNKVIAEKINEDINLDNVDKIIK